MIDTTALYVFAMVTNSYSFHQCQVLLDKTYNLDRKVQVGKDQEKAQSEKDSHSKNRGGKKPN